MRKKKRNSLLFFTRAVSYTHKKRTLWLLCREIGAQSSARIHSLHKRRGVVPIWRHRRWTVSLRIFQKRSPGKSNQERQFIKQQRWTTPYNERKCKEQRHSNFAHFQGDACFFRDDVNASTVKHAINNIGAKRVPFSNSSWEKRVFKHTCSARKVKQFLSVIWPCRM